MTKTAWTRFGFSIFTILSLESTLIAGTPGQMKALCTPAPGVPALAGVGKVKPNLATAAPAPEFSVTCEGTSYPKGETPKSVEDGKFNIPLESSCILKLTRRGDFKKLHEFFIARLSKLGTLKDQGHPAELEKLPGKVWKVTDKFTQKGDKMEVDNQSQIACDDATRLISTTKSTKVTGSGDSSYVNYIDSVVDVTSQDGLTFKVVFKTNIKVKLPGITFGLLNGTAEGNAKAGFVETRDSLSKQIGSALLEK